jgi:DNA-binding transcriptional regulator/RsmH inhibitor MraZ
VILVGVDRKVEIWDRAAFEKQRAEAPKPEEHADKLGIRV